MVEIKNTIAEDFKRYGKYLSTQPRKIQFNQFSTVPVPIISVSSADSPQLGGEDKGRVRLLAEAETTPPPIVAHRATMHIIRGMHRLHATKLQGRDEVKVFSYLGDEERSFIFAAKANIAHSLRMPLTERTATAPQIITIHPPWLDRKIVLITGFTSTTVGAIGRRPAEKTGQSNSNIGRGGRTRSANSATGGMLASKLLAESPDTSLREIAKVPGLSPSTPHVNARPHSRMDPVRNQQLGAGRSKQQPTRQKSKSALENRLANAVANRDRWLRKRKTSAEWRVRLINEIPLQRGSTIAELASGVRNVWHRLAKQLERRKNQEYK